MTTTVPGIERKQKTRLRRTGTGGSNSGPVRSKEAEPPPLLKGMLVVSRVPYPEEFQRLDDAAEAWDKEHAEQPDCERRPRPKDGFNSGGYEWRVTNWGTKWPACHLDIEGPVTGYDGKTLEVVFHFETAWSPPAPVIAKAAERYPALTFELRYFECGCCFNGLFRLSGGEVLTDESGAYFGDRGG